MTRFTFRNAAAGDEESIQRVVGGVLREYGFVFEPDAFDSDLNDIVASYHDRGGLFRVLVDEAGEIVGCGGVLRLNDDEAQLRKMYILPQARGRGYGRQLLQDLLDHARARGFQRVSLETSSRLPGAGAHLYHEYGFVDVPNTQASGRADMAMILHLVKPVDSRA